MSTQHRYGIDKVRASKAGHAFHEAWAARTALELLPPSTDLTAITLEGFDEARRAELGNWRGRDWPILSGTTALPMLPGLIESRSFSSNTRSQAPQRRFERLTWASTLAKFAATDAELRATHGDDHVLAVVRYEFATNRPIHENLGKAISAVVTGTQEAGDICRQAGQLSASPESVSPSLC